MESDEQILAEHPFFKDVDGGYLQQISKGAEHRKFSPGDYVIREGDNADYFFLILKGRINILTDKLESLELEEPVPVPIQTLVQSEILGWSWLVPPYQWRFDAKAVEPTEVIVLDAVYVRKQCEDDPKLGYELLKRLATSVTQRLTATRLQLSMHAGKPFSEAEGA